MCVDGPSLDSRQLILEASKSEASIINIYMALNKLSNKGLWAITNDATVIIIMVGSQIG